MGSVLQELVGILVDGISSFATGIAEGVNGYVQALFLVQEADGYKLSTFGGVVAIFAGIALAVTITTLIFNWIKSMGN